MLKLTSTFKKPCNFQCNSPQRVAWELSTIKTNPEHYGAIKAVVTDDGHVFINKEKYVTGVINTRVAGGKWERINYNLATIARNSSTNINNTTVHYFAKYELSEFKGSPRVTGKTKTDYIVDANKVKEMISAKQNQIF